LAPTKAPGIRAWPPTPFGLFRLAAPWPPLWPRLLNGLLLPKALLVPGLIPLPVVRLPNMPDELVDWAATLSAAPRSMTSIKTDRIRVHCMIAFHSNSRR
jgi:hypothetical protein